MKFTKLACWTCSSQVPLQIWELLKVDAHDGWESSMHECRRRYSSYYASQTYYNIECKSILRVNAIVLLHAGNASNQRGKYSTMNQAEPEAETTLLIWKLHAYQLIAYKLWEYIGNLFDSATWFVIDIRRWVQLVSWRLKWLKPAVLSELCVKAGQIQEYRGRLLTSIFYRSSKWGAACPKCQVWQPII